MTPISVGLSIPASAAPGADPVGAIIRAEALGFDFVSCSDHPCGTSPTNETWTMLCFAAARTSRIGIATRVLGVPYRAPAIVAKMAETLDRMSNGRLILGLGGGSADDEHRAFGLGVRSPKEKVDGLEDAVTIIRGLWTQTSFTHRGRLYSTEAAELEPKPTRHIPIWLGTFGPRALRPTGRLADGWIPSLGYMPRQELPRMREHVIEAAREAGRDETDVTCALNLAVRIGSAPGSADTHDLVTGDPGTVAEQLKELAGMGFTVFNFMVTGPDSDKQIEQLAQEVLPSLRSSGRGTGRSR